MTFGFLNPTVLALGASGALRLFAPIQPLLALASLGLVAWALWVRLGSAVVCPLPPPGRRAGQMPSSR
jgi:hypothetical protein